MIPVISGNVQDNSIPDILKQWYENGLTVSFIRSVLKTYPLHPSIKKHCLQTQSKAQIAILLWVHYRWMKDKHYARFKLKDLSEVCGISVKKLSKAVKPLKDSFLILKPRLHYSWVIANGAQYHLPFIPESMKSYINILTKKG